MAIFQLNSQLTGKSAGNALKFSLAYDAIRKNSAQIQTLAGKNGQFPCRNYQGIGGVVTGKLGEASGNFVVIPGSMADQPFERSILDFYLNQSAHAAAGNSARWRALNETVRETKGSVSEPVRTT